MTDTWTLTTEEEAIILATARYNKIKKLQWLTKLEWIGGDVDVVELTPEEVEKALHLANKSKTFKLHAEALAADNRMRTKIELEEVRSEWDSAGFFKVMKAEAKKQGIKLIFNEQTERLIKTICFKLAGDSRYETEMGFRFDRGLILRGEPGLGKTWIVSLVAANPVKSVQMVTMHEITRSVLDTGQYNGLKFASYDLVYLDDVGTEGGEVTYFGSKINWFKTWFEELYAKHKFSMSRLILSTNCSFTDFEKLYGFRVRDRMAEMFDVLDITGASLRRKN